MDNPHVSSSGQSEIEEVSVFHPSSGGSSVKRPPAPIVSSLPEHQVRDLTEAFKMFDLDGDGKISRGELGRVLRSLGETMTEEELGQMIRDVDANGDGEIDLQEFINLNIVVADSSSSSAGGTGSGETGSLNDDRKNGASTSSSSEETEALQSAFEVFDSDKDGFISAGELYRVLSSLGDEQISLDDCCYMISCVDLDGDQLVDFKEFQTLMSGNPAH